MKDIYLITLPSGFFIIFWTWALNFPWNWVLYLVIVIELLLLCINWLCFAYMETTGGWLPVVSVTYSVALQSILFVLIGIFRLGVAVVQWIF